MNTYNYENNRKYKNYYIIRNLRKINIDIKKYEKIEEATKKYFSILKELYYFNEYDFKVLDNGFQIANYIYQLNDGSIGYYNNERENIYQNYTFKLQLSIGDFNGINSFIQLNNGNLIICTNDGMKLVKLINNNSHIEQTITINDLNMRKVFEIRKNVLISISNNKFMKIWILNKNNQFEWNFCFKYLYY